MTDTLTVTVNRREHTVPQNTETLDQFLTELGYTPDFERQDPSDAYKVHRSDECSACGNGEDVELTNTMFVFDDGDEFTVIPRHITGG